MRHGENGEFCFIFKLFYHTFIRLSIVFLKFFYFSRKEPITVQTHTPAPRRFQKYHYIILFHKDRRGRRSLQSQYQIRRQTCRGDHRSSAQNAMIFMNGGNNIILLLIKNITDYSSTASGPPSLAREGFPVTLRQARRVEQAPPLQTNFRTTIKPVGADTISALFSSGAY